jgi:hypothetical protein
MGWLKARNAKRLAWLQQAPQARYSLRGGIALDQTLVTPEGKLLEDVGWFWEHADQGHVITHDAVSSQDVCPSGAPSPVEWRRFQKRAAWTVGECKEHTALGRARSDASKRARPGDGTVDRSLTSTQGLHHLQSTQRAYVGDLQLHRQVVYAGREQPLQEVAQQIPWAAQNSVRMGRTPYGSCTKPRRLPDVTHPGRRVLFWRERGAPEARKALVPNRLAQTQH